MKKMPCVFERRFEGRNKVEVLPVVTPSCRWVFDEPGTLVTRKWDGTATLVRDGKLYKRYDAKKGRDGSFKAPPDGAIPCDEPDPITGHWPHWVEVNLESPKPEDKWIAEAGLLARFTDNWKDGTYEACGPKIGANPQGFLAHVLKRHGDESFLCQWGGATDDLDRMTRVKNALAQVFGDWEGFVFHRANTDTMCKIRRADFGLAWPAAQ